MGVRVTAQGPADALPRIAAAARLLLHARSVVRGTTAGERAGARAGAGVEFHGFVAYSPGADVRRIDPLASARTGRLLLRTTREETRRTVHVVLDRSPSMGLSPWGAHRGRWEAARTLALATVLASTTGGDRARVWTFTHGAAVPLPVRTGRPAVLALALASLDPAAPGGTTDLDTGLRAVAMRCRRGDPVVVITDLLSPGPSPLATVRALCGRRNPVVVLHLLGAEDRSLPAGPVRLRPVEPGTAVTLDGTAAAEAYAHALAAWEATWRSALGQAGARTVRVDADRSLVAALAEAVHGRPKGASS